MAILPTLRHFPHHGELDDARREAARFGCTLELLDQTRADALPPLIFRNPQFENVNCFASPFVTGDRGGNMGPRILWRVRIS